MRRLSLVRFPAEPEFCAAARNQYRIDALSRLWFGSSQESGFQSDDEPLSGRYLRAAKSTEFAIRVFSARFVSPRDGAPPLISQPNPRAA